MMRPEPSTTVYSWYMPDVVEIAERFALAREGRVTTLLKGNYDPGLDDAHDVLLDKYLFTCITEVFDWEEIVLRWKKCLPNAYYTNGSSEGLFHLIARHKTHFPGVPLYQFEGEYQGYDEYAKTLGASFESVRFGTDLSTLPPGVFFVSVPSAVDGNTVASSVINAICEAGHYVVIDIAYAGMANMQDDLLTLSDRVVAVVGSMSKPFGLYYYRVGFLWSRDPIDSLYGNRWFKNIHSIELATDVLSEYGPFDLAEGYRDRQTRACVDASEHFGIEIKPSDVWLLGHVLPDAHTAIPNSLLPFKRGPGYRVCLTPYYMHYAKEADA